MSDFTIDLNKMMAQTRLKKKATQYENFSSSKQTFDELRFIEAINGNLVLRGRNHRPDKIIPFNIAWKRFWTFYSMCCNWMNHGFKTQCEQLKQVLQEWGAKIQEAVSQRIAFGQKPDWFTPEASQKLSTAIKNLKESNMIIIMQ